jgi:hypothetical protein
MRNLFGLATLLMAFLLVGCEADPAFGTAVPGAGGAAGGGGATGGTTVAIAMGSGTGAAYQDGVIAISATNLQAGGSASLTVNFVDTNNSNAPAAGTSITVSFASTCTPLLANIVEDTITTTTGTATATYSATGCSGNDTITASALVNDVPLTATAQVTVAAATVGSIQFVSADPTNIGLLGTGGVGRQETSTVRFAVTDSTGGPVSGATVDFTLNTTIGGIQLTPTTATSDVQGFAQTVVSAGSVATSVRVTATVNPSAPVIAAQSDQLTITTGIPDQDSVSLSMECVNIEGWARDGITTEVTMRMSDRYNNPVPDDTTVTFSAEGGQVGGACQTATTPTNGGGVCSVTFVSQDPRPADGRVSILATAIGEESFIDADSNGRFGVGDTEFAIGEPFRNDNENVDGMLNPIYDPGEIFADFNSNGIRDAATLDPDYIGFNGLLCDEPVPPNVPVLCNIPNKTLFVSDQGVVVLSAGAATITDDVAGVITLMPSGGEGVATFNLTIGDNKGNGTTIQPMAAGTTIDVSTSNGSMIGKDSYAMLCSNNNGPAVFGFAVKGDATGDGGLITAEVTSPSGVVTIHTITFND